MRTLLCCIIYLLNTKLRNHFDIYDMFCFSHARMLYKVRTHFTACSCTQTIFNSSVDNRSSIFLWMTQKSKKNISAKEVIFVTKMHAVRMYYNY